MCSTPPELARSALEAAPDAMIISDASGSIRFVNRQVCDRIQRALAKDQANRAELKGRRRIRERLESLTPREREVLMLVASGKAYKVMARALGSQNER
jgi:DNA-binding NarL/FixJ family response regulator